VDSGVEGDEADERALSARDRVERCANRRARRRERARRDGRKGDVEDEDKYGRLRRADHVFDGRDELDGARAELDALVHIRAHAVLVRRRELRGGDIVDLAAEVAAPAAPAVDEAREGVDLRAALFAAHDARGAKVDDGDAPAERALALRERVHREAKGQRGAAEELRVARDRVERDGHLGGEALRGLVHLRHRDDAARRGGGSDRAR
jgi:hypothetical protein